MPSPTYATNTESLYMDSYGFIRLDRKGQGKPCGKGFISARKKCSKDKTQQLAADLKAGDKGAKARVARGAQLAKDRQALRREVERDAGKIARNIEGDRFLRDPKAKEVIDDAQWKKLNPSELKRGGEFKMIQFGDEDENGVGTITEHHGVVTSINRKAGTIAFKPLNGDGAVQKVNFTPRDDRFYRASAKAPKLAYELQRAGEAAQELSQTKNWQKQESEKRASRTAELGGNTKGYDKRREQAAWSERMAKGVTKQLESEIRVGEEALRQLKRI